MGIKLYAGHQENIGDPAGEPTLVVPTERPGDRIGRYKLLQQIGEGGCGTVYMAEQEEPVRRRVALKLIKLGMDTKQVIARFEAERQALAVMDHPNIARVFDAGATQTGRPFFVMELVRGVRITECCDQHNLSTRERLELFIKVCRAVQHAHQKGIIHRDIKPSNILVTLNDGLPAPKIIDFGIAKATGVRLSDKTLFTQFEAFVGTPAYMSPEQAERTSLDIDTRSDIYSLGVLLYELLTGKTPFAGHQLLEGGLNEMRRTIREKDPPRPSTRLSAMQNDELSTTAQHRRIQAAKLLHLVRGDLDSIVMKCLEKDRTRRYETANGLAMDIQRYLADEPVVARPPSAVYRMQKMVRRHKAAVCATAAIAILLMVSTLTMTWLALRAKHAENHAQAEATRASAEAKRAQEAEKIATEKSTLAEAQRLHAEQQAEATRLISYVDAVNVAQRYCHEQNFAQAMNLLQSQQPPPRKEDFRGFEWRYLFRLCRGNYSVTLPRHEQVLGSMEFSSKGHWLASYCWDGKLRVWDFENKAPTPLFERANISGLGGFSLDGDRLIFGGPKGTIQMFDVGNEQVITVLEGAGEIMSYSARANLVVTVAEDRQIQVWSLAARNIRFSLPRIQRYLEFGWTDRGAMAPDGTVLAVVEAGEGTEGTQRDVGIRLWDLATGNTLGLLPDKRQIRALRFSPNGRLLAVGDGQGGVKLWDLIQREAKSMDAHILPVSSLAFSPDGNLLATGGYDETIRLWSVASGAEQPNHFRGHSGAVSALAFSPDGKLIASGSRNSTVKLWKLEQVDTPDEIRGLHTQFYANFAFSPDAKSIAAGCADGTVVVWNLATLQTNAVLEGMRYVVGFTHDSRHLLVSGAGDIGYWFDLETKRPHMLPMHSGTWNKVRCVDLSPDRQLAALGYDNGMIEFWELESGKPRGSLPAHSGPVHTLRFSADGATLVSGGSDRAVKTWDTKRQVKLGEKVEHKGAVCAAALSADGMRLASGCGAGTIKLWEASHLTNALVTIPCHKSAVRSLDFSVDGRTLASGGEDRVVKLWNTASLTMGGSQREVASFPVNDKVRLVQFSPDGNVLAIVTDGGVLRFLRAITLTEATDGTTNGNR